MAAVARTTRPVAKRPATSDPLAVLRAMPPLLVTDLGEGGAVDLVSLRSAIREAPEVLAGRLWARGDPFRVLAVSNAIGALSARSYRHSTDTLARATIPF